MTDEEKLVINDSGTIRTFPDKESFKEWEKEGDKEKTLEIEGNFLEGCTCPKTRLEIKDSGRLDFPGCVCPETLEVKDSSIFFYDPTPRPIMSVTPSATIIIESPTGKKLTLDFETDKLIVIGDLEPDEAAQVFIEALDNMFFKRILEDKLTSYKQQVKEAFNCLLSECALMSYSKDYDTALDIRQKIVNKMEELGLEAKNGK